MGKRMLAGGSGELVAWGLGGQLTASHPSTAPGHRRAFLEVCLYLFALILSTSPFAECAHAQRVCRKGKPCGNTCIAVNRTCRIAPPVAAGDSNASDARDTTGARSLVSKKPTAPASDSIFAKAGRTKVWANTKSRVYHCPGSRYYGTTSAGEWMTEAAAVKANYRGANNRRCGSP